MASHSAARLGRLVDHEEDVAAFGTAFAEVVARAARAYGG